MIIIVKSQHFLYCSSPFPWPVRCFREKLCRRGGRVHVFLDTPDKSAFATWSSFRLSVLPGSVRLSSWSSEIWLRYPVTNHFDLVFLLRRERGHFGEPESTLFFSFIESSSDSPSSRFASWREFYQFFFGWVWGLLGRFARYLFPASTLLAAEYFPPSLKQAVSSPPRV